MDDDAPDLPALGRYPTLAAFLQGYLHQDYEVEHGSAPAAVRAWRHDAGGAGAARLLEEWRGFMAATRGWTLEARADVLVDDLGSAWTPQSSRELRALSRAVIAAARPRHDRGKY